jgi:hypothetical protein
MYDMLLDILIVYVTTTMGRDIHIAAYKHKISKWTFPRSLFVPTDEGCATVSAKIVDWNIEYQHIELVIPVSCEWVRAVRLKGNDDSGCPCDVRQRASPEPLRRQVLHHVFITATMAEGSWFAIDKTCMADSRWVFYTKHLTRQDDVAYVDLVQQFVMDKLTEYKGPQRVTPVDQSKAPPSETKDVAPAPPAPSRPHVGYNWAGYVAAGTWARYFFTFMPFITPGMAASRDTHVMREHLWKRKSFTCCELVLSLLLLNDSFNSTYHQARYEDGLTDTEPLASRPDVVVMLFKYWGDCIRPHKTMMGMRWRTDEVACNKITTSGNTIMNSRWA